MSSLSNVLPCVSTTGCGSFVAASVPKYCYIFMLAVYTISVGGVTHRASSVDSNFYIYHRYTASKAQRFRPPRGFKLLPFYL